MKGYFQVKHILRATGKAKENCPTQRKNVWTSIHLHGFFVKQAELLRHREVHRPISYTYATVYKTWISTPQSK